MADDPIIGGADISKMAAAIKAAREANKEYSSGLSDVVLSQQRMNQTIVPMLEHMDKFPDRAKRAAAEAKTFNDRLKELIESTVKWAKANNQARDIASSAVSKFKELINVTNIYNRRLRILRESQDLYTRSLHVHTGAQAKASEGLAKSIRIVEGQYKASREMMKKFHITEKEGREIYQAATKQFMTQIMAYKDSDKAMKELSETAVILKRRLGMDTAEYMKYLNDRMRATNMTLKEAGKETLLVASAYDEFNKHLAKTPGELQKANVTAQAFMRTIQQAGEAFKFGKFEAGAFAHAMLPLMETGKKYGLNAAEIENSMSMAVKQIKKLSDPSLQNIFGVQAAQDVVNNIDEWIEKGDEATKKRLSLVREGLRSGNRTEIQALRGVLQAAGGSSKLLSLLMTKYKGLAQMLRVEMQTALEESNPLGAQALAQSWDEMTKRMTEFAMDDTKAAKKQAEFQAKQTELAMAAQTPQDNAYAAVISLDENISAAISWLKEHWGVAMIAGLAPIALIAANEIKKLLYLRVIARNTALGGGGGPVPGRGGPAGVAGSAGRAARASTYAARRASTAASVAKAAVPVTAAGAAAGASKVGLLTRAGRGLAGAGKGALGLVGGGAGLAGTLSSLARGGVYLRGAMAGLEGIQAAASTKGNVLAKGQAGSEAFGYGMLSASTMGLISADKFKNWEKGLAKSIAGKMSESERRKLGGDVSLSRILAESKGAKYLWGAGAQLAFGGRTGEQQKILDEMDKQRRNMRAAVTEEDVKRYKALENQKKLGMALTAEQEKYLKLRERDIELYKESIKLAEKEEKTKSGRLVRQALSSSWLAETKEKMMGVMDPKERARLLVRDLVTEVGSGEAAPGLKALFKDKSIQGRAIVAQLKGMGLTEESIMGMLPSEVKAGRIREAAGMGLKSAEGVSEEELTAYRQMMLRRKARGMSTDTAVVSAAIAAGKREGTGQELQISVVGADAGDGMPQEGKLNSVTGTMEYELPGSKFSFYIGNLNKGLKQNDSDNTPPSNTSKPA